MPLYIRVLLLSFVLLPQTAMLQETNWIDEEQRYREHFRLWTSRNVTQYSYVADSGCLDCFWYFPAIVSVSNGNIVSIIDPDTGSLMRSKTIEGETRVVFPQQVDRYLTIEAIFEKIDEAIRNREGMVPADSRMALWMTVDYDESYGYPTSLSTEYGYGRGVLIRDSHSWFSVKVSNFTP